MDLPCTEWIKHAEHKWTRLQSATGEGFPAFTDVDDLFHFGESQLQPEDLEALSRISEKYHVKKSSECAAKFREQGNVSFKGKDYTSAALYYTQGVCHAEKNTEELSLCYANRSAALFHLGLYTKCLEDIQQAFDEGYPSYLQGKLVDRQLKCSSRVKMQEYQKASPEHQTPQTAKKGVEASVSSSVSVDFTPEKGRHLLATEKKSAGEILVEDEAFSFVLIPVSREYKKPVKASILASEPRHCHHCLSENLYSVPCRSCTYAQYCKQECEVEAWNQYHCWECPLGSELLALGLFAHLALRVTLKAGINQVQRAKESCNNLAYELPKATFISSGGKSCSSGETSDSLDLLSEMNVGEPPISKQCCKGSEHSRCYHGKSYLSIYSLLPHVEKHSHDLCFLFALTMAAISQRLSQQVQPCHDHDEGSVWWDSEKSLLGGTALRHMLQLRCNAQAVTVIKVKEDTSLPVQSSKELRIATAVFPILSLLNHACQPNTSISFRLGQCSSGSSSPGYFSSGLRVIVRACRDIAAGQELLHCYGPHSSRLDVEKRQRLLHMQYFFQCQCEACKLELADKSKMLPLTFNGLKCEKCGNFLETRVDMHVCSHCDNFILNTELQKRMGILQHYLEQAVELMENNQINDALSILQKAANLADRFLMKVHPLQGELSDATARAYATMGLWKNAASHLKYSIDAVCSQYGTDSVELGRQQYKLAQLHFNGGDGPAALSVIPLARRLLMLYCDPQCTELQELQAMEVCLRNTT